MLTIGEGLLLLAIVCAAWVMVSPTPELWMSRLGNALLDTKVGKWIEKKLK